jgi:Mu-like prophage I protein
MSRQFMVFTEKLSAFSGDQLTEGVWVQASPMGTFHHPVYGEEVVDESRIDRFIQHFNDNVYGQDLPINYEHFGRDASKGFKAAGWVREMERRDDGMYWRVVFTEEASNEIKDGAWKYFSPEWYDEWQDKTTQVKFKDVPAGGALTNQPFYKNMVPLNFSELAAEVAALPATNEVADWEHSEPATGPTPRQDNDDDGNSQGTRGTSPPVEPDPDAYDVEDNMDEFLKKLGELLKLEGEPTEDTVLAAFTERVNEAQPIVDALEDAKTAQAFSERYPAEFEKMQRLEASDRENKAKAFADRYAKQRVVKVTGEGESETKEDTPFGFSALAVSKIEDMHKAFSTGQLTEEHLTDVLDAVLTNGMVDYSERGTSRVEEAPADAESAKKAFAEKVAEIRVADNLDYGAAVKIASEKHPDLARQYAAAARTK